jgi:hypothetical protein
MSINSMHVSSSTIHVWIRDLGHTLCIKLSNISSASDASLSGGALLRCPVRTTAPCFPLMAVLTVFHEDQQMFHDCAKGNNSSPLIRNMTGLPAGHCRRENIASRKTEWLHLHFRSASPSHLPSLQLQRSESKLATFLFNSTFNVQD